MAEDDIFQSPGPLIRRFHQIGLAIFTSRLSSLDITPLQFSIMWVLKFGSGKSKRTGGGVR